MERPAREETLPAIKRLFDIFDVARDGLIDFDDVKVILKQMGLHPSPSVIRSIIAAVDTKKDHVIDFDEFTAMRRAGGTSDLNIIAEFKRFDVDDLHRGWITPESLRRVLRAEGYAADEATAYAARIMAADSDGDGKVSFRDLHALLTKRVPVEWAEWIAENVQRGVADERMLSILEENGFEREQAMKLVQETRRVGHAVTSFNYADTSTNYIYTLRA